MAIQGIEKIFVVNTQEGDGLPCLAVVVDGLGCMTVELTDEIDHLELKMGPDIADHLTAFLTQARADRWVSKGAQG